MNVLIGRSQVDPKDPIFTKILSSVRSIFNWAREAYATGHLLQRSTRQSESRVFAVRSNWGASKALKFLSLSTETKRERERQICIPFHVFLEREREKKRDFSCLVVMAVERRSAYQKGRRSSHSFSAARLDSRALFRCRNGRRRVWGYIYI